MSSASAISDAAYRDLQRAEQGRRYGFDAAAPMAIYVSGQGLADTHTCLDEIEEAVAVLQGAETRMRKQDRALLKVIDVVRAMRRTFTGPTARNIPNATEAA